MALKIGIGRLMSPENITFTLQVQKEAHEKSIIQRKELCGSLGLKAQVAMCDYKPKPENFYQRLTEKEMSVIVQLIQQVWSHSDMEEFSDCEMPDGILQELSFLKNNKILCNWWIYKLTDSLGFCVLGQQSLDNQETFLVARWGDADEMKSFKEMESLASVREQYKKNQKEEEFQKTFAEKVVAKVPLTEAAEKWAIDSHRNYPRDKIIIIGRVLFRYHCRSRMYKVKIVCYQYENKSGFVCSECGIWEEKNRRPLG